MLDVMCMPPCTAGVLVRFQLRITFGKQMFPFVFSRKKASECQKQRILPKNIVQLRVDQETGFQKFRAECFTCEVLVRGKETGKLLNGIIQILDGIMTQ